MVSYVPSASLSFALRLPCPPLCCAPYACSLNNTLLIGRAKNNYSSDRRYPCSCSTVDSTRPFFASATPECSLDQPHHQSRAPKTKHPPFDPGPRGHCYLLDNRILCVHWMSPTAPRRILFLAPATRSIVHACRYTKRHPQYGGDT